MAVNCPALRWLVSPSLQGKSNLTEGMVRVNWEKKTGLFGDVLSREKFQDVSIDYGLVTMRVDVTDNLLDVLPHHWDEVYAAKYE